MPYREDTHRHLYAVWTQALQDQVDHEFSDASVVRQKMAWGDLKEYVMKHAMSINPEADDYSDEELDIIFNERQERYSDARDGGSDR